MSRNAVLTVRKVAVAAGLAAVASCAPPPPPPAPPPPPEPVVIPARPVPPEGAAGTLMIPPKGADGVRLTVNAHISPLEAVWNFRSGWNVAALNCLSPGYQPILEGYKQFLKRHGKRLSVVNKAIDKEYRSRLGSGAVRERETYMTRVYNYFALPPAHDYFCDAALQVSQEALLAPPSDADAFALASLPRFEAAFERFFGEMEQYRIAAAEWDARYGYTYGAGQGGTMLSEASVSQPYAPGGATQLSTGSAAYVQNASAQEVQPVAQPVSRPVVQPVAGVSPASVAGTPPASPEPDAQTVFQPVVQPLPGQEPPPAAPAGQSVSVPVVQPIPGEDGR